jgi:hypothetical protein
LKVWTPCKAIQVVLIIVFLAGCAGRGGRDGEAEAARRLGRIADEVGKVALVEGRGKASVENRLGRVDMEFDMFYEPGRILELKGELEPGFLPFHGAVEIISTPDTTLAYINGVPLVPDDRAYPGRVVHPALVAIVLGGDWVLDWLKAEGCGARENVACGDLEFEFDLDDETGHVKAWTLKHEDPDGSYDGFLYRSLPRGRLELPGILTGMVHPFEVSLYVEYYQIDATVR